MRGSREISLVPSLHRASTDALIHQLDRCALSIYTNSIAELRDAMDMLAANVFMFIGAVLRLCETYFSSLMQRN